MYEVQRMKKATLTGCHSKLSGATILGGLLCKSSIYLLNTTCSCGDLNAAIRFCSRLTGAKINIIYEKIYLSIYFILFSFSIPVRIPCFEHEVDLP